jgi:flagellin-like protein
MRDFKNKKEMDNPFRFSFGKKGVSEIVSYVLLISITFVIAGVVYSWLMFYVTPGKETKCEEGISLTIRGYFYNCSTKQFNLTIQNRGLFDVDGYILRVNNQSGSDMGVYTLNSTGKKMNTSEVHIDFYADSSKLRDNKELKGIIKFVEIQPFVSQNRTNPIYCESVAKQEIICS